MSLSYSHYLIAAEPSFRPGPDAIADFMSALIERRHVAENATIRFAVVAREPNGARRIANPFTGEMIDMPLPSRRAEKARRLASATQIVDCATDPPEYDVSLDGTGRPSAPPLQIGYVEGNFWKATEGEYHLEISCRVRAHTVRLSHFEREEDMHGPPDITKYRPRFDEDCSDEKRPGLFVHPELGAVRIANAGCASFWIEFNYGKFVFPRASAGSVSVLSDSVVNLAQKIFGHEFVQACHWG
jgi:hypothetical protein